MTTQSKFAKFALLPDWQRILKKAWSIRLTVLAGLFSAAEVILPLFSDVLPRHLFVVLAFVAIVGAAVARLVAQPEMHR